jgi:hypothetical protein
VRPGAAVDDRLQSLPETQIWFWFLPYFFNQDNTSALK